MSPSPCYVDRCHDFPKAACIVVVIVQVGAREVTSCPDPRPRVLIDLDVVQAREGASRCDCTPLWWRRERPR